MGGSLLMRILLALLLVGIILLIRHFLIKRRRSLVEQGHYDRQPGTAVPPGHAFTSVPGANALAPDGSACVGCGAALQQDAAFCEQCGSPNGSVQASTAARCPSCGAETAADEAFCSECGAKVQ